MHRFLLLVFFIFLTVTGVTADGREAADRPAPLPEKSLLRPPRHHADLSHCAILSDGRPESAELTGLLRRELKKHWQLEPPPLTAAEAAGSGHTLFLAGTPVDHPWLTRMRALGMLSGEAAPHGEIRVIPDLPDRGCALVYLGGATPEQVREGIARFFRLYPEKPATLPHRIDCEGFTPSRTPEEHREELDELYAAGANAETANNTVTARLLNIMEDYRGTGNDAYAELFAAEVRRMRENYTRMLGPRGVSPHFIFHRIPAAVEVVEGSPAFTEQDRRNAAELIAMVGNEIFNDNDMKLPRRLFREGKHTYLTNHPLFAIRAMYFCGDFLARRYDYEPANMWREVAEYHFQDMMQHIASPEDSIAYQFHVLNGMLDYLLGSGKDTADSIRNNPAFRDYLRYAKAMINPLGGTPGFGDAYPVSKLMGGMGAFLNSCRRELADPESEFYFQLFQQFSQNPQAAASAAIRSSAPQQQPGDRTPAGAPPVEKGWQVFPVTPAKLTALRMPDVFRLSTMDKAVFRSSWDPGRSVYVYLTGINGGPHGHFDANGICSYIAGGLEWLAERDYVKKYPIDHNSLDVTFQNRSTDWPIHWSRAAATPGNVSQLLGSAASADGQSALISLLLEDYNHSTWIRHIAVNEKNGLQIIDEVRAEADGGFIAECYWRVQAQPERKTPDGVDFTRSGRTFHLRAAECVPHVRSSFEHGSNAREEGYFDAYRATGGLHTAQVTERREATLKKGEGIFFANDFQLDSPRRFERLRPGLWRSGEGEQAALLGVGRQIIGDLTVEADFFRLTPDGLLAVNLRTPPLPERTPQEFAALINGLPALPVAREQVSLPAPAESWTFPAAVTALAAHDKLAAIGCADGTFEVRDETGRVLLRQKYAMPITAVAMIPDAEGAVQWAVGLAPGPQDQTGKIILLAADGKERWSVPTVYYQRHRGIPRTLFPARLQSGAAPAIVAGTTAWMYLVFDGATGKRLLRLPILHPARQGAAGDLNGDGRDELLGASEYYSTSLFLPDGKRIYNRSLPPYGLHQVAADLDGDGRDEFYSARGDGTLYRFRLPPPDGKKEKVTEESINIGGSAVNLLAHRGKLHSISTSGIHTLVDAKFQAERRNLHTGILQFNAADGFLAALTADGRILRGSPEKGFVEAASAPIAPAEIAPILSAGGAAAVYFSSGRTVWIVR